jgi:uncharacterized protein YacL
MKMDIRIYGIEHFSNVINWFQSLYTILLLAIFTFVVAYFFYKLNFVRHKDETSSTHHYILNVLIFGIYGVILFWVSKFVLKMDLMMSAIFTLVFYSLLLYVLTITMIIMRRHKIKRWVIDKINFINNNPNLEWKREEHNPLYIIRSKCISDGHKYLDWFLEDIDGVKGIDSENKKACGGKRPLDITKYRKINIWKDENMKREEF